MARGKAIGRGVYNYQEPKILPCEKLPTPTREQIYQSIVRQSNGNGITEEVLEKFTNLINDHFGYSGRIVDTGLPTKNRIDFYKLFDLGILLTDREEGSIKKYGHRNYSNWVTHFWILNKKLIFEDKKLETKPEHVVLYSDELFEEVREECLSNGIAYPIS